MNPKGRKKIWRMDLGKAIFIGKRKVADRIIKKNLTKKDLEIIELFLEP